jgi:hypothetical protein
MLFARLRPSVNTGSLIVPVQKLVKIENQNRFLLIVLKIFNVVRPAQAFG